MSRNHYRYLSLEWINELTAQVAASDHMRELAASHQLGVTQVVSAGPEGDVTYHLQIGNGEASFGALGHDLGDSDLVRLSDLAHVLAGGDLCGEFVDPGQAEISVLRHPRSLPDREPDVRRLP